MTTTEKKVAYVFQEATGWFVCDDAAGMLDARGASYPTKRAAIASLRELAERGRTDYTHYRIAAGEPRKLA